MARSEDWLGIALPAAFAVVGLTLALCGGFALAVAEGTGAFARLEAWWTAPAPWTPEFAVDPATTGGIDHARLHEKLLPDWVIAGGRRGSPAGDAAMAEASAAVRAAIAADPNLGALFDDLDARVIAGPVNDPYGLIAASEAWSRYLAARGVPWRVHGTVRGGVGEDGSFTLKTYHVLASFEARVDDADRGGSDAHVEIVTRTDGLNVVEGYLGAVATPEEGARVIVDRVQTFAIDTLWPLFDGAPGGDLSARALGPAVVAEASAALPDDVLAVLRATAADRRRLVDAVGAIRARRDCGSRFVVYDVPWDGFEAEDGFADVAERDRGEACPAVTVDEAEAIATSSAAIRATPGAREAVEALVAFAVRPTVVHEVRHVADGGVGAEILCLSGCDGLSNAARAELSAYLASFAAPGLGATALLQACAQRATGGSHAEAMGRIGFLGPACDAGAPNLTAAAREAEGVVFDRSARITLPGDLPARLPVR